LDATELTGKAFHISKKLLMVAGQSPLWMHARLFPSTTDRSRIMLGMLLPVLVF